MLTIHTDLGDIDYALNRAELFRRERLINPMIKFRGIKKCIEAIIDAKTSLFRAEQIYAMDYIQSQGLRRPKSVRILHANGNSGYNPEFYEYQDFNEDGSSFYKSIFGWVNEHERQYDTLVIKPCNPAGISVSATWSFVIFPIGNDSEVIGISYPLLGLSESSSKDRKFIETNNKYPSNNIFYPVFYNKEL